MPHLDDLIVRIYLDISVLDEKTDKLYPIVEDTKGNAPQDTINSIIDIKGNFYQQLSDGTFRKTDPIPDAETRPFLTTTWLKLPDGLRSIYVEEHWPDCKLESYLLLVHGKEKGQEMIDDFNWASTHEVYTDDITMEIKEKIGRFTKVEELDSGLCFPDNADINNTCWYQYLLDDRWVVTVTEHLNPFYNLSFDMLPKNLFDQMERFEKLPDVTVNIVDTKK